MAQQAKVVVCPACQGLNRVSEDRLGDAPKCGKCGESLFQSQPVEVDQAGFNRFIQKSEIPVVVDFWAPWCGPCQMMAPFFQEAAARLEPHVVLLKVNTEEQQMLASQYGIRSIPTLAIFKNGQEVTRNPGAMQTDQIIQWVNANR